MEKNVEHKINVPHQTHLTNLINYSTFCTITYFIPHRMSTIDTNASSYCSQNHVKHFTKMTNKVGHKYVKWRNQASKSRVNAGAGEGGKILSR